MHCKSPAPLLLALLCCFPTTGQDRPRPDRPDSGPGVGPGAGLGGPGPMRDLPVLQRFDQDGDGRLDPGERSRARQWLRANRPQRGPRGFGGRAGGRQRPGREPDTQAPAGEVPGRAVTPADVAAFADRDLFDPDVVRTFFLTFPQADWYEELQDFYRTDVDLPAAVTVDGHDYRDVGVHFRGNTSYQMVPGKKKALHLDFDQFVKGQKLHGHSALNLINNNEDPSLLREALGAWIANRHTEAPRATLVRVVVNGEDFGVYSAVEHFDQDFTGEHFGSRKGSRFKVPPDFSGGAALAWLGDDPDAYRRGYELKSKDEPQAWVRLGELCALLADGDDARLLRELPERLDLDGALWFLAVDNALLDGDGYYSRGSDYALWLDPDGRFHPIARDGNEILGSGRGPGRVRPGGRGSGGPPGGDWGGRRPPFDGPPFGPPDGGPPGGGPDRLPGRRGGGPGGPGGMRQPTVDQPALAQVDDSNRPLIRRLLGIPAWRERYLAFLHTLVADTLDPAVVGPRIDAWRRAIEPLVQIDAHSLAGSAAFAAEFDESNGASLVAILAQRRAMLLADPALRGPWPQVADVEHALVGTPASATAVRVRARAGGDLPVTMVLHFAAGRSGPFAAVAMRDDGQDGDGAAGDGVFAATTPELPPGSEVRYWVEATAGSGRVACAPASAGVRPSVVVLPGKPGERDR